MKKPPPPIVHSALSSLRARPVVRLVFAGEHHPRIHAGVARAAREFNWQLDDTPCLHSGTAYRDRVNGLLLVPNPGKTCPVLKGEAATAPRVSMLHALVPSEAQTSAGLVVLPDWDAAGRLAAEHLLSLRLPNVAYWRTGETGIGAGKLWAPFLQVFAERKAAPPQCWNIDDDYPTTPFDCFSEDAHVWLLKKLSLLARPGVIMAESDHHAYRVVQAARQLRLRVPADIAVMGVGDQQNVQEKSPVSLSSIDLDMERLGHAAARRLRGCLTQNGAGTGAETTIIPLNRLIERESTMAFYSEDSQVAQVVLRIRRDFSQPLNVTMLAREVGLSVPLLHARYARVTGATVGKSLRLARLNAATALLRETDLKLESVAAETGVGDVRSLFRLFKEHYGVPPGQWRENHWHGFEDAISNA